MSRMKSRAPSPTSAAAALSASLISPSPGFPPPCPVDPARAGGAPCVPKIRPRAKPLRPGSAISSASGRGSIINISSIAGIIAGHNMAAYNSAKAAVRHLTKSVALHCAKQGYDIRCNSVHPSFVRTAILDPLVERLGAEKAYAKLARQIPMGRIGEPDDVAYGVLYLASDESSFMTGAELVIDGGISAM
ncbi:MAG: SDR family oxidoreductase [Proteobacteria bacterium]|nr:SDR family oxidoreductase [Pseudomonadota bacterium]